MPAPQPITQKEINDAKKKADQWYMGFDIHIYQEIVMEMMLQRINQIIAYQQESERSYLLLYSLLWRLATEKLGMTIEELQHTLSTISIEQPYGQKGG